eukprot:CAMPEP_0175041810 /NCGR_PEP_ID=MMETSP0052_2-20121109/2154_1 /TAXON_ID=51329 ORGANISM="Polytomella parva, Strain SAG 63-3" /NCGR_SAMPLE_ID=MMETSP0052_2 /ASSEMBLY_ACC=CAM_ASM_000194 /LENGTH=790 /DNA_ID=CAMNT_0016304431 /DNA_START=414 /DNA_END=2783 /DNA_ORIENTATION=+
MRKQVEDKGEITLSLSNPSTFSLSPQHCQKMGRDKNVDPFKNPLYTSTIAFPMSKSGVSDFDFEGFLSPRDTVAVPNTIDECLEKCDEKTISLDRLGNVSTFLKEVSNPSIQYNKGKSSNRHEEVPCINENLNVSGSKNANDVNSPYDEMSNPEIDTLLCHDEWKDKKSLRHYSDSFASSNNRATKQLPVNHPSSLLLPPLTITAISIPPPLIPSAPLTPPPLQLESSPGSFESALLDPDLPPIAFSSESPRACPTFSSTLGREKEGGIISGSGNETSPRLGGRRDGGEVERVSLQVPDSDLKNSPKESWEYLRPSYSLNLPQAIKMAINIQWTTNYPSPSSIPFLSPRSSPWPALPAPLPSFTLSVNQRCAPFREPLPLLLLGLACIHEGYLSPVEGPQTLHAPSPMTIDLDPDAFITAADQRSARSHFKELPGSGCGSHQGDDGNRPSNPLFKIRTAMDVQKAIDVVPPEQRPALRDAFDRLALALVGRDGEGKRGKGNEEEGDKEEEGKEDKKFQLYDRLGVLLIRRFIDEIASKMVNAVKESQRKDEDGMNKKCDSGNSDDDGGNDDNNGENDKSKGKEKEKGNNGKKETGYLGSEPNVEEQMRCNSSSSLPSLSQADSPPSSARCHPPPRPLPEIIPPTADSPDFTLVYSSLSSVFQPSLLPLPVLVPSESLVQSCARTAFCMGCSDASYYFLQDKLSTSVLPKPASIDPLLSDVLHRYRHALLCTAVPHEGSIGPIQFGSWDGGTKGKAVISDEKRWTMALSIAAPTAESLAAAFGSESRVFGS